MSTGSSLREALERRVPVQGIPRVRSGSPASVLLKADRELLLAVSAAEAMVKRHLTLKMAHHAVDRLAVGEAVALSLPVVEDAAAFVREMRAAGVTAEVRRPPPQVDARAIRSKLGLSMEEFAARSGFSPAELQAWEEGRARPEAAARTLLAVIERDPAAVEAVLAA